MLSQLVEAQKTPDVTLRGVAMLDPATSVDEIMRLSDAGIVGMRLNLIGGGARDFDVAPWDGLLRQIDKAGWHVEVHCEGAFLPPLLEVLLSRCEKVVVDHFGLPNANAPLDCSGLSAITNAPAGRVFVKISAPYRVFPALPVADAAHRSAPILNRLIESIGEDQLVWGSDWPWTRFEDRHSYGAALGWFEECTPDR